MLFNKIKCDVCKYRSEPREIKIKHRLRMCLACRHDKEQLAKAVKMSEAEAALREQLPHWLVNIAVWRTRRYGK